MTAKYTGTLTTGGIYALTGKTWNGSEWVTETLTFEVQIIQPILKNMVWKARRNKTKRSTDGPITVRFIEKLTPSVPAQLVQNGRIDLGQHCGFCQHLLTECSCPKGTAESILESAIARHLEEDR